MPEKVIKTSISIGTDDLTPVSQKIVSPYSNSAKTNSKKNSILLQCSHLLIWLEKSYEQRSQTRKKDIAQSLGESKKTMDDYLKCMRRGIAFNYDFIENREETFGHLRTFLETKERDLGHERFKNEFTNLKKDINIPVVKEKIKEIINYNNEEKI